MMSAGTHIQRMAACCGGSFVLLAAATAGMRQLPATVQQPSRRESPSRTPSPLGSTANTQGSLASPHGSPDGCSACHAPQAGPPRAIPREAVDVMCLACHDGVRATREPHPIGRSADGPQLTRPPADLSLIHI